MQIFKMLRGCTVDRETVRIRQRTRFAAAVAGRRRPTPRAIRTADGGAGAFVNVVGMGCGHAGHLEWGAGWRWGVGGMKFAREWRAAVAGRDSVGRRDYLVSISLPFLVMRRR